MLLILILIRFLSLSLLYSLFLFHTLANDMFQYKLFVLPQIPLVY